MTTMALCTFSINRHTITSTNSNRKQLNTCAISRQTWPEGNMSHNKSLLKLGRKDFRIVVVVLSAYCIIEKSCQ